MPEQNDNLLLDHEYDGIKELDNRLPGWWLWLFYLAIAFGLVYMGWFHVLHRGPLQADLYIQEVEAAHAAGLGLHYESWGPDVEPATDPDLLAHGGTIFKSQCTVCHGQEGQGVIGPNMTDDYFLHGHEFADSIVVIEEGVPEQGMISWKTQLSRDDVLAVGSYIYTLRGTNPANPKDPQGEKAPSVSDDDMTDDDMTDDDMTDDDTSDTMTDDEDS